MRAALGAVLVVCVAGFVAAADEKNKPIKPEDAVNHVDEKLTVEMEVKSTGKTRPGTMVFLNSESDWKDKKNFTVVLENPVLDRIKKDVKAEKVEDLEAHFKGKTIRVTGTIKVYGADKRPEIKVMEADQIKVMEKK